MIHINSCSIPFSTSHSSLVVRDGICRVSIALDFPESYFNARPNDVNINVSIMLPSFNVARPMNQPLLSNKVYGREAPKASDDGNYWSVGDEPLNELDDDHTSPVTPHKNNNNAKRPVRNASSGILKAKKAKRVEFAEEEEEDLFENLHSPPPTAARKESTTIPVGNSKPNPTTKENDNKKLLSSSPSEPPTKPKSSKPAAAVPIKCDCVMCETCQHSRNHRKMYADIKCPHCQCCAACMWKRFTMLSVVQRTEIMVRGKPDEDSPSTYGIIARASAQDGTYEVRYPTTNHDKQKAFEHHIMTLKEIKPLICQATNKDQYESLLTLCK